ncbi:hypothetical protein Tco_0025480 [Tanacetum coccineum]
MVKNKSLVSKAYEWDEEDVLPNDNEIVEVKVLMALANDENVVVGKKVPELVSGLMRRKEKISNSNKEVVMIAPRVRDVYVLEMTSLCLCQSI